MDGQLSIRQTDIAILKINLFVVWHFTQKKEAIHKTIVMTPHIRKTWNYNTIHTREENKHWAIKATQEKDFNRQR